MFDILVIDPPYPQRKGGKRKVRPYQERTLDYQTLSIQEIFQLLDKEIFPLAKSPHVVFLWSIEKFLSISEKEMLSRDYKLHVRLIWDKGNGVAPAFTIRYTHEYLLWFYKPPLLPIDKSMRGKITSVIQAQAREHSHKPDKIYEIINKWFPNHSKIDVFSREKREGWEQFGNEIDHFNVSL